MIRAVLFDWGDTLMRFAYDEALVEAGFQAGLEAIDGDRMSHVGELAAHERDLLVVQAQIALHQRVDVDRNRLG